MLWSDNPNDTQSLLWLLPYNTTGNFVLQLATAQQIYGFRLRNTHNDHYEDFGTRGFTVEISSDGSHWQTVVTGTLPDAVGASSLPFETFTISATTAQYVRFTATSWYHNGKGGQGQKGVQCS